MDDERVYVERHGRIEKTPVTFENDDHLMRIIDRIVAPLGRRVDEASHLWSMLVYQVGTV
jgi:pilus assembly protein CpaF